MKSRHNYLQPITFFVMLIAFISLFSCKKEETPEPQAYENGFFIINEGPFNTGSGSLTFVSDDYTTIEQNAFKNVNDEDLGNIVQSMAVKDDLALIVVNNSHKIVFANSYTMEKIAEITEGINNPRYAVFYNDKAYISNWGESTDPNDDFIAIVDLNTFSVIKNIKVGEGPERIVINGSDIYVSLKGGYGANNKVVKIDAQNDEIVRTYVLDEYLPNHMVFKGDDLYVLCEGKPAYLGETQASIYRINNTDFQQKILNFPDTQHPDFLGINNSDFYYHNNGMIYKWDGSSTLPNTSETGLDGYFYGMQINEGYLYATDAKDYASAGSLYIYDLSNNTLLNEIETGIIPNSVVFNP